MGLLGGIKLRQFLSFTFFAVVLFLAACGNEKQEAVDSNDGDTTENKLNKIQLVLDWTPNTNHTGLYVAQENGYFEDEGLNVEIIMPGEAGANQLVAAGKAEFGITVQETLTEARVGGIPLVSLAAILQHNTSGLASLTEANIESPKDYEGKSYGGWGSPVEQAIIKSLMDKEDADFEKVNYINSGDTDFFTAIQRDIDFAWIYYGWTGIEAELRNIELNMHYLTDFSNQLDYYTPVLMTNEKMIVEEPNTVQAFMNAVAKGYDFSIKNPEEAATILVNQVPDLDEDLVHASQVWISEQYQADAPRWGEQKIEIWENYAQWMIDNDLLEDEFIAEDAFTNEFLPQ